MAGKIPIPADADPSRLQGELDRSLDRRDRLVQALKALKAVAPRLTATFDRLLLQLG